METKAFPIKIAVLILLIFGTIVATILVSQRQLFTPQAATPTGLATLSLSPQNANLQLNQPLPITLSFNSPGVPISAITVRLSHASSATTLSNLQINSSLLASGDWSCPIRTITSSTLNLACITTNPAGFISATSTPLTTFDLTTSAVPIPNPIILTFDTAQSIITKKSDGSDTSAIPTSGTYNFVANSPTPTPGEPNSCGGTCGSHNNCKAGLFCYQGYCRNPICPSAANCICATPTPPPTGGPTATPKPSPTPEIVDYTETPVPSPSPSPIPTPTPEPLPAPLRASDASGKLAFYHLLLLVGIPGLIFLILLGLIIKKLRQSQ